MAYAYASILLDYGTLVIVHSPVYSVLVHHSSHCYLLRGVNLAYQFPPLLSAALAINVFVVFDICLRGVCHFVVAVAVDFPIDLL